MQSVLKLIFAVIGVLLLFVPLASGATVWYGSLDPFQEPPPPVRVSNGSGYGTAMYDTATFMLAVNLVWSDLNAPAAASHIHCCAGPGQHAAVAVDFVPAGFPALVTGSFNESFDLSMPTSYSAGFLAMFGGDVTAARNAVLAGMDAGTAYFNIHTPPPVGYPAGEIRGQISPVPEPGSLVLLISGAAILSIRRRWVQS